MTLSATSCVQYRKYLTNIILACLGGGLACKKHFKIMAALEVPVSNQANDFRLSFSVLKFSILVWKLALKRSTDL